MLRELGECLLRGRVALRLRRSLRFHVRMQRHMETHSHTQRHTVAQRHHTGTENVRTSLSHCTWSAPSPLVGSRHAQAHATGHVTKQGRRLHREICQLAKHGNRSEAELKLAHSNEVQQ